MSETIRSQAAIATQSSSGQSGPVRYHDGLEVVQPNEAEVNRKLTEGMHKISGAMAEKYRHAVHSKSHAALIGELEVFEGLPPRLAQGLFRQGGRYPVVMRFSTTPGDLLADSVSTPRALSVKIVGPAGEEMVAGHEGEVTQDFVMINAPGFHMKDAEAFMKSNKPVELTLNAPEQVKVAASLGARAADALLSKVGHPVPLIRKMGGHPYTHPLGESFYTQLPLRWGEYVGKVGVVPASANLRKLKDAPVHVLGHPNALRDAISDVISAQPTAWDVQVQLCVDLNKMPIEDASVEWSEQLSPYITVGRIHVAAQDSYRPDKQVCADDRLSFDPWHALAAHRPLGNVMRARKLAYEMSRKFRREHNDEAIAEPRSRGDLPQP